MKKLFFNSEKLYFYLNYIVITIYFVYLWPNSRVSESNTSIVVDK